MTILRQELYAKASLTTDFQNGFGYVEPSSPIAWTSLITSTAGGVNIFTLAGGNIGISVPNTVSNKHILFLHAHIYVQLSTASSWANFMFYNDIFAFSGSPNDSIHVRSIGTNSIVLVEFTKTISLKGSSLSVIGFGPTAVSNSFDLIYVKGTSNYQSYLSATFLRV